MMTSKPSKYKGNTDTNFRNFTVEEISILEKKICNAKNWDEILVSKDFDINGLHSVYFSGPVVIENGVIIRNVKGGIGGCRIKENALIDNVDRIEFQPEAQCGVGTAVNVLDETGSRPVRIFPGLTSQIATLMAREPKWFENNIQAGFEDYIDSLIPPHEIGENSIIRDCGRLINVSVGNSVVIEGASSLVNGTIINNSNATGNIPVPVTYIGYGVDAENFIAEDCKIDSGCIIRNCYIGQGVELSHGFTAHDSLFFANCKFENGEACALLAGPYTVSMHKGTLLIGCQTSFMNAGSSTNESNHMYKLGPVHWGILERGVKTSSGAYIMFGAKIGAFSMVMGSHKTHPDSSSFPFSYLFGDERGATVVVPGAMLRSCGLLRDEKKWPTRDRRLKNRLPLNDNITFNVLNPFTVDSMLNSLDIITELLSHPADDDLYVRYKGMKFTRAALDRAKNLYTGAIFKYLSETLPDYKFPDKKNSDYDSWVDLGGQIITRNTLNSVMEEEDIAGVKLILSEAFDNYKDNELEWIADRFDARWRLSPEEIIEWTNKFDDLVEEDRNEYLENLSRENKMLSL